MTPTLHVKSIKRFIPDLPAEELEFKPGVNVLVGPRNAGKTTWLKMIDYAFADSDTAEKALGAPIAEKYSSLEMTISIAGESHIIGRNWKEKNTKTKITLDGNVIDLKEFNEFIFKKLDWPEVVYASGDPYAERTWRTLGFRMPFRHMYRQARFWSDFVPQQQPADFYACIMLFLGLAEKRYPAEHGDIVKANKEIDRLTYKKDNLVEMLTQVSQQLGSARDVGNTPTMETLQKAIEHYQAEIERITESRRVLLITTAKSAESDDGKAIWNEQLQEKWSDLNQRRTTLADEENSIRERLLEVEEYRDRVNQERGRLDRTLVAGEILTGIKITHCPACDQTVDASVVLEDQCYLCHQPHFIAESSKLNTKRIEFEKAQLEEELSEISSMTKLLEAEQINLSSEMRQLDLEMQDLQRKLAPVRSAVAAIMPTEVTVADQTIGAFSERIKMLEGLKTALSQRDNINQEITDIENKISILRTKVAEASEGLTFTIPSQRLTDGFNSYLNALNKDIQRYDKDLLGKVNITKTDVKVTIQGSRWQDKLGDTNTGFFVLAYNYALLQLLQYPEYRFPGFEILDFPMDFAEAGTNEDAENYLVEPFCELQDRSTSVDWQVIVAGRSFKGLKKCNQIELTNTWK